MEHGLSCRNGGLVILRHNELAAEWQSLCASALAPSAVSTEPKIFTGRTNDESNETDGANRVTVDKDRRGDVGVRGFWKRGTTAIFDVRITNTESGSYRGRDPGNILSSQEAEKKKLYLQPCLERRRQFTPLVFSVDGLMGKEASAATKRLASLLSAKWARQYSETCGFVRSRISVALVRATSLCLRGARNGKERRNPLWNGGPGLSLYW